MKCAVAFCALMATALPPLPAKANECDPPKRIRMRSNCGIAPVRAKMRVELIDQDGHFGDVAYTDDQGLFQFKFAKPGKYTLRAEVPGSDVLLWPIYLSLEDKSNCDLVLDIAPKTGMDCLTFAYVNVKDFKKYKQEAQQKNAASH
jgi:hypothetical protein